jgi:hypothetical protein
MAMLIGFVLFCIVLQVVSGLGANSSIMLLQVLLGPLVFFGSVAAKARPPSRQTLMRVTVLFICIALFELVAPSQYVSLASLLLDRATVADGHRGLSLLTPEPTYTAISLIYLVLLSYWSRQTDDCRYAWIESAQVFLLLMTLSTYVAVFAMVLAIVKWPRTCLVLITLLVLLLPNLGVVGLENGDSVRAVVAVSRILTSDFSDFLTSLSMLDPSLGSRLISNFASFQTPTFSAFGYGLDGQAVPTVFDIFGYTTIASANEVLYQGMAAGNLKPQSYVAAVALGMGFMSLLYVILLVIAMRSSSSSHQRHVIWKPALAISLVMLTVQIQLTSPIPWMLAYLAFFQPQHRNIEFGKRSWLRYLRTISA